MLNVFRKHATSWMIKVALLLIALVFIFWGGFSYRDMKKNQVAQIDDHYITVAEYGRAYDQTVEMYKRQLGKNFSEDMIRQFNLKQQALDLLIERYLLSRAARDMGLNATVKEIQEKILEFPVFQIEGKFDETRYRMILQQNRLTPEVFEQQLGEDISGQKVQEIIKRRVLVTNEEIDADLQLNYSSSQIAYIAFDPQTFEGEVAVSEEALQTFYEAHKDNYKEPEKRRISYVLFKNEDHLKQITLNDDDLRKAYEEKKADYFHAPEVQALHILFKVDENAPEPEVSRVKGEAEKVLAEAKMGKDFGELARKHSQDPSVAQNGGDLGWFTREKMVQEFSDAAFALQKGEIGELVRSPFGFHIIKVMDARPERMESFEEVKNRLERSIKEERSKDIAYKEALDFSDSAMGQQGVAKAAQTKGLTVVGSDVWVAQKDKLPGFEVPTRELMKTLFAMPEKGISKASEVPQGFLIASVDAVQAPQVPPLESIKERVIKEYKKQESARIAKEKAAGILQEAEKAGSLEKIAGERKLEVKKSGWFSRKEPDNDLKLLQGPPLNSVLQLEPGHPFPVEPVVMGNRYLAVQLLVKKKADVQDSNKRSEALDRLQEEKQEMVWAGWMEQQRQKANVKMLNEI